MTPMVRLGAALAVLAALSACTVRNPPKTNSPDELVARAKYVHSGPPRLTLFTMVSNRTGAGAHTSLLINGSQRVAFDPAGSFRTKGIVAKNDVVYGMTPYMVDQYTRFHARETFHVVVQSIDVSPEVAELALRQAQQAGPALESQCAYTTSSIVASLPGFSDAPVTYYPLKLSEYFTAKGAETQQLYEYDDDDKTKVLRAFVPDYDTETVVTN